MLHLLVALTAATLAQDPAPRIDPPVNEAALAGRLLDMTKPSRGERAIILFDPTYYPGITTRLREGLHQRGIQTYTIVEDTPDMVLTYRDDDGAHDTRVEDVVETLRPLFKRADIFYWMPIRGYGDDLRWERLVEAEVAVEGRVLVAGGRIQWDAVAAVARPDRQGEGPRP